MIVRQAFALVLILSVLLCGCSRQTNLSEGFETVSDDEQLPSGWSLATKKGTYRIAQVGDSVEGVSAIAIAGSGGRTKVTGPSIQVQPNQILLGRIWLKPKLARAAECFIGFESAGGDDQNQLSARRDINGQSTEWTEAWCVIPAQSAAEAMSTRFTIELVGDGVLLCDDLQISHYQIESSIQLNNTAFESVDTDGHINDWHESSDLGPAKAERVSASRRKVADCLRLEGDGGWAVATQYLPIQLRNNIVLFTAYVRAKKGEAGLKIEFFHDEQDLGDARSAKTSGDSWELLSVVCDTARFKDANQMRITLASESSPKSTGSVAYFDELSLEVLKK